MAARHHATVSEPHDRLLPVLQQRWSPRHFDPQHVLADDDVAVLLEAARWAPSAGNSQPWAFEPVLRGGARWADLMETLAGSARAWVTGAGLVVVNLAHMLVEDTDWEYSEFSAYDLGQAVAHLTIQAQAMGLSCRQFRAFDKERVTALLEVPTHWEVMTMTAVGRALPDAPAPPGTGDRVRSVRWPRD